MTKDSLSSLAWGRGTTNSCKKTWLSSLFGHLKHHLSFNIKTTQKPSTIVHIFERLAALFFSNTAFNFRSYKQSSIHQHKSKEIRWVCVCACKNGGRFTEIMSGTGNTSKLIRGTHVSICTWASWWITSDHKCNLIH